MSDILESVSFFNTHLDRASWGKNKPEIFQELKDFGNELLFATDNSATRMKDYTDLCLFHFPVEEEPAPAPHERPGDFYLRRLDYADLLSEFHEAFDPFAIAMRVQLAKRAQNDRTEEFRQQRDAVLRLAHKHQRDPYKLHLLRREP